MAERDTPMTSDALAQCLGTNPVVVRRTMGLLRNAGLVTADRGHAGGWRISADLAKVTLRQLHEALGEPALFAVGNRNEQPSCLVEQVINAALDTAFADDVRTLYSQIKHGRTLEIRKKRFRKQAW